MDQSQQTTLDRIASTVEEISKSGKRLVEFMDDETTSLSNKRTGVDDFQMSVVKNETLPVPLHGKGHSLGGMNDRLMAFYVETLETYKKSPCGLFSLGDVLRFDAKERPVSPLELEEVMSRYEAFKRFDIVSDYSSHLFSAQMATQFPAGFDAKMKKELDDVKKRLPENMVVRTYEGREDLLTAVIIEPKGTPYHDGSYFFDINFPTAYPDCPPLVRYRSCGLKINPNLGVRGSVCLHFPKRVNGRLVDEVQWMPGKSTILDFLNFLRSLFGVNPLLNGVEYCDPAMFDGLHLLFYNENVFLRSVRTMVAVITKPPENFEDFVVGHFRIHAAEIMKACKAYLEGAQVGCVVNGVPTEGHKGTASVTFRKN